MTNHRPYAEDAVMREIILRIEQSVNETRQDVSDVRIELRLGQTQLRDEVREVKVQTTKTNGRVSRLENWRAYLTGALATIGVLSAWLLYLLVNGHLK